MIEPLGDPWVETYGPSQIYHPTSGELVEKINEIIKYLNDNEKTA